MGRRIPYIPYFNDSNVFSQKNAFAIVLNLLKSNFMQNQKKVMSQLCKNVLQANGQMNGQDRRILYQSRVCNTKHSEFMNFE